MKIYKDWNSFPCFYRQTHWSFQMWWPLVLLTRANCYRSINLRGTGSRRVHNHIGQRSIGCVCAFLSDVKYGGEFKYQPAIFTVKMSPNFFLCSSRNVWASLPNSRAFPTKGIQPFISGGSPSLLHRREKRNLFHTLMINSSLFLVQGNFSCVNV